MEWVVTTGKTVDEAKEAALDELGVDAHDAEFEILEEPRQGLFGRQRGEARVRARVRPSVPRPKADRRDRKRKRADSTNVRSASEDTAVAPEPEPKPARARRGGAKAAGTAAAAAAPAADTEAVDSAPAEESPKRKRRPSKAAATAASPEATAGARTARTAKARPGPGTDDDDDNAGMPADGGTAMGEQELDLAQQAEIAETFVRGLLESFGLPAQTTTVTLDEETFEVQVAGEELGLLIGPKGQTLQAVQELTRTAVQRRASNRTGRILVDIAGYRVKRRDALERFTRQVADDVVASGVQRVLEPMSPADRKIVHDTANLLDGVRTLSEGEEPQRRVVIIPDTAVDADASGRGACPPLRGGRAGRPHAAVGDGRRQGGAGGGPQARVPRTGAGCCARRARLAADSGAAAFRHGRRPGVGRRRAGAPAPRGPSRPGVGAGGGAPPPGLGADGGRRSLGTHRARHRGCGTGGGNGTGTLPRGRIGGGGAQLWASGGDSRVRRPAPRGRGDVLGRRAARAERHAMARGRPRGSGPDPPPGARRRLGGAGSDRALPGPVPAAGGDPGEAPPLRLLTFPRPFHVERAASQVRPLRPAWTAGRTDRTGGIRGSLRTGRVEVHPG
jgi:spoIIIJ-associated protein